MTQQLESHLFREAHPQCETSRSPHPRWVPTLLRTVFECGLAVSLPPHWAVHPRKTSSWGPQHSIDTPGHLLDRTGWGQAMDL